MEREQSTMSETKQMYDKMIALEKEKTSYELELKAMNLKYEQDTKSLKDITNNATNGTSNNSNSISTSNMGPSVRGIVAQHHSNNESSVITNLQDQLNTEKAKRQQAEASSQEKERQVSMLSVDYRQLQQRVSKLEGENRQEIEKVKGLQKQLENETDRRNSLSTELQRTVSEVSFSIQ